MTYEGMFDEVECKFELERQKKYIQKQASIIFALERELEEKNKKKKRKRGKEERKKNIRKRRERRRGPKTRESDTFSSLS